MVKAELVAIVLLAATLIACGGVSDNPPDEPGQSVIPTSTIVETVSSQVKPEVVTPESQSESSSSTSPATQSSQPSVDDDRVEGLVSEWETDLAPINRISGCVEQALGLERPLRPEDFQLQANQPAILSCVKSEVGNE